MNLSRILKQPMIDEQPRNDKTKFCYILLLRRYALVISSAIAGMMAIPSTTLHSAGRCSRPKETPVEATPEALPEA